MHCPNCPEERLLMSERTGVEIDYCPKCRGVWLDRGELDKLLEKAAELAVADAPAPAPSPVAAAASPPPPRYEEPRYAERKPYKEYKRYDDDYDRYKHKKKKSLLSEIFDF